MRKVICLVTALLICVSMALPVFAADGKFVPSITIKDGPEIEDAKLGGEDVGDCVVVTSIPEAKDKSTDITQEERDTLLDVYKELSDGSMTLPMDDDYVIRELVDVSFEYEDCRTQEDHNKKDEKLNEKGVTLTVDFDLGIGAGVDVVVFTYIDGEWKPIESVKNNGDGTVTCVFEDICPVAFAVKQSQYDTPPKTGDAFGQNLGLWIGVMAVAAVALVVVIVATRKKNK